MFFFLVLQFQQLRLVVAVTGGDLGVPLLSLPLDLQYELEYKSIHLSPLYSQLVLLGWRGAIPTLGLLRLGVHLFFLNTKLTNLQGS